MLAVGPVQYVQGNGEVATAPYAEALDSGVEIGPNQSFDYYYATMASVAKGWIFDFRRNGCFDHHEILGDWVNVSDRYIGLAFLINGQTHYGWARFSVQVGYVYVNATLTGYAYETSTGESIKAGQTKEAADDSTNENFDPDASLTNPIPDTSRPASLGTLALGARGIPLWRRKEPEWSSIGVPAVKN